MQCQRESTWEFIMKAAANDKIKLYEYKFDYESYNTNQIQ